MAGRPWELLLVVYGFSAQSSALSFESAWQRPHSSRHLAGMWRGTGQGKCTGATRVPVRMRALAMLLEHEMWSADVLTVRVHASCGRLDDSVVSSTRCDGRRRGALSFGHGGPATARSEHECERANTSVDFSKQVLGW